MIKPGFTLYATKANNRWFVKQAKSPQHFVRLCVADEKANGWFVQLRHRGLYLPNFTWNEAEKVWYSDGRPYGPKLPPGAR